MKIIAAILALLPLFVADASTPIEKKIGQMIMVGFRGTDVDVSTLVVQQADLGQIGGVILNDWDGIHKNFNRNISSPKQLKALCKFLQAHAEHPLFIAIDQEGGVVNRLKPEYGFPRTFSAEELSQGAAGLTFNAAENIGKTLKKAGINLNLAPVADLKKSNDNPDFSNKGRSFGDNPVMVANHVYSFWKGQQAQGILTTLKHFPGLGSSSKSTHLEFSDISDSWSDDELIPFSFLLPGYDELIMTGHVFNRNIDSKYPASLSKKTVQGLLRDKLGFKGLVITDDLQMKAITNHYSLRESVKLAILAGSDILLFANSEHYDEAIAPKVIALVKEMVNNKEIPKKRIEESYKRILSIKKRID